VPDTIALEEALQHYFQSMVEEICNRITHHFAGKNNYFIVAKGIKAMVDSWLVIKHWKMINNITIVLSAKNCIIESKTSATRVIEGHSLGDDWALVGLHYLESMVEVTERSCYLEWSPFN